MGWKEYQAKQSVRHTFDELGCPDFYVDLRRVDAFPYGYVKEYGKSDTIDPETATREEIEAQLETNDEILAMCIADWNITHPETNESLPVPTSKDWSSLDALPSEFVAQMHEWLGEDSELSQRVPRSSET